MARSSILRTIARLAEAIRRAAELVDQRSTIAAARSFCDVERHDDGTVGIRVEHVVDLRTFEADAGSDLGQYISHHITGATVVEVAKSMADEDRMDAVFERQTVGKFAVNQRPRRQPLPEPP